MWKLLKFTKKKAYCGRVATRRITCTPQHLTCHMASDQEFCAALSWPSQLSLWKQPSLSNAPLLIKMHWSKQRYGSSTLYCHFRSVLAFSLQTLNSDTSGAYEMTVGILFEKALLGSLFHKKVQDHSLQNSIQRPPRLLEKIIDLNKKQEIQRNWWTWRISPLVWLVFLRFFGAGFQLFLVGSHLGLSCPGHTPCYTASSSEPQ